MALPGNVTSICTDSVDSGLGDEFGCDEPLSLAPSSSDGIVVGVEQAEDVVQPSFEPFLKQIREEVKSDLRSLHEAARAPPAQQIHVEPLKQTSILSFVKKGSPKKNEPGRDVSGQREKRNVVCSKPHTQELAAVRKRKRKDMEEQERTFRESLALMKMKGNLTIYIYLTYSVTHVARILDRFAPMMSRTQLIAFENLVLGNPCVILGYAGVGKSHVLALSLKVATDRFVMTKNGTAAIQLLNQYARIWKLTPQQARAELLERNVRVDHYDGLFGISPSITTKQAYMEKLKKDPVKLERVTSLFRYCPPRDIVLDEAWTISMDKFNMLADIFTEFTRVEYNRQLTLYEVDGLTGYQDRFMGVRSIALCGDPYQPESVNRNGERNGLFGTSFMRSFFEPDKIFVLLEQQRQKDTIYNPHLVNIMEGDIPAQTHQYLAALKVVEDVHPDDNMMLLTPYRKVAAAHNEMCIKKLDPEIVGPIMEYSTVYEYQVKIREIDSETGAVSIRTEWKKASPEDDFFMCLNIFNEVSCGDKYITEKDNREEQVAFLYDKKYFALGVLVIIGYNDNSTDLRNGTYKTVVGFTQKGDIVCSDPDVAAAYFKEHKQYGYYKETINTGETIIVQPIVSSGTLTSAVNGKKVACRMKVYKLVPTFACTLDRVQGITLPDHMTALVDLKRLFRRGLSIVALTRSRKPPVLRWPYTPETDLKLNYYAIGLYKEFKENMIKKIMPQYERSFAQRNNLE